MIDSKLKVEISRIQFYFSIILQLNQVFIQNTSIFSIENMFIHFSGLSVTTNKD